MASHQGFSKIGGDIGIATKVSSFHSLFFQKMEGGYIFIGEEGNRRGHLGIPKVPYIKTLLENSKDFTENKETLK